MAFSVALIVQQATNRKQLTVLIHVMLFASHAATWWRLLNCQGVLYSKA